LYAFSNDFHHHRHIILAKMQFLCSLNTERDNIQIMSRDVMDYFFGVGVAVVTCFVILVLSAAVLVLSIGDQ